MHRQACTQTHALNLCVRVCVYVFVCVYVRACVNVNYIITILAYMETHK
jgi:hypothetical protein